MRRIRPGVGVASALAGLLVLGTTTPRQAASAMHLRLTASNPAADTALTTSPSLIQLWYSDVPQLKLSRVALKGPSGAVKLGAVQQDKKNPKLLTATVTAPLATGRYQIDWRTASADGHAIKGTISFRVGAAE
jgi:methionine-rich copper-binding protein CopC